MREIPEEFHKIPQTHWIPVLLLELVDELRCIRGILKSLLIHKVEVNLVPQTIAVGQSAVAVLTATGSNGQPYILSATDTIALSSSTPADESFGAPIFNSDGTVSVPVTGLAVASGDTISAVVDGVTSTTDTLTITAAAPVTVASVTLTLEPSGTTSGNLTPAQEQAREALRLKTVGNN